MSDRPPDELQALRLRTLFNSIDQGYCLCEMIVDESGAPIDYRFLEVNPLFETMTGLVDPVGKTALDLVPDLELEWITAYARVGLDRETFRFQQGSEAMGRWFDVFSVPVEPRGTFAIVFKDETERHRRDLELRESEQRFRSMADNLPLMIWQTDANGRPEWVNTSFCEFYGIDVNAAPADFDWWASVDRSHVAATATDLATALMHHSAYELETRVRRADGEWRWIENRARPHLSPDGSFIGYIGTSQDVTERRQAAEALRASVDRAAFHVRLVEALRSSTSAAEVERQSAHLLGEFLGAARVQHAEIDEAGEYAVVVDDYHPSAFSVAGRHRLDVFGIAAMSDVRAGRAAVSDDITADDRLTDEERSAIHALGIGSYVLVPLVKHGRATAAIAVQHHGPHRWTSEEIAVIEDASERIYVALHRVRDDESTKTRQVRAELVTEIIAALEAHSSVEAQLDVLANSLVPRIADYVSIETPNGDEPVALAHRDPALVETLRTLRTHHRVEMHDPNSTVHAAAGRSHLISEISSELVASYASDPGRSELLARLAPRSHMAVPLDIGGKAGALVVGIVDPNRPNYTADDLRFLRETAQRVGVVLEASRLRQEEHNISVRLQQALLPDSVAWHPNLLIEARYVAASTIMEVGGDWYDTFSWPDGRIGIITGDVGGHNLESAAAMGRLRAATAAVAMYVDPSPAALLEAVDRIARGPNGTAFATAVCVVIDPTTGELTYSCAGHPPVVIVAPDGTVEYLDQATGLPICVLADAQRPEASMMLASGSLVVMYSDGLIERRSTPIDEGIELVERLVVGNANRPLGTVLEHLVAEVVSGSQLDDDVVIACCRYAPPLASLTSRIPARADQLSGLRSELREWLQRHDLESDDVLIAVGEACANAVEHAYMAAEATEISVEVTDHGHYLAAKISDHGSWRSPTPLRPHGGRGTQIMKGLATHFRRTTDDDGTTVSMVLPAIRRQH